MRFKMALKDGLSGREYDKFTTDDDGNAALRMVSVAGVSGSGGTVTASGSATVAITHTVLIDKTAVNSKPGTWYVLNGATTPALTVQMYSAVSPDAPVFASGSGYWDQVGSNITVSESGGKKHIPFNNTYRYIALVAQTASSSGSAEGWLYSA
jgi:hypothetical protein